MTYKSITAFVTRVDTDTAMILAAVKMAAQMDAHLDIHCLGIDAALYEPMPPGAVIGVMSMAHDEARTQAKALVKAVHAMIPSPQTKLTIEPVISARLGLDGSVARLSRFSDLVFCTRPYGPQISPLSVAVLEAALFGSGAPVIVIPSTFTEFSPSFSRVVVAWNEAEEAFEAIRKSLPILTAAERVDIAIVDPPSHSPERSDPGGAICLMLARHGVNAEVSVLSRTLPRPADVITRFANDKNADLIVMGAYGHSRFREAVLGGMTRDMLGIAETPLLMAH